VVILDSVRWPSDLKFVRRHPGGVLLHVTGSPQTRFERLRRRNEKAGERGMTWYGFQEEETALTERYVPELGKQADFTFENEGTLEEFRSAMRTFCAEHVLGRI
jgi:dephospho-CoA kinase